MRRVVPFVVLMALSLLGRTARAEVASEPAPPAEVAHARSEIEGTLVQMKSTALRVREDLRYTRRRGTKVQIACVDEALSRADVASRRARLAGDEALVAYGRGEVEQARAALRRLVEIRESQRLAARDGAQCTAAAARLAAPAQAATTVRVDVDPAIPQVN